MTRKRNKFSSLRSSCSLITVSDKQIKLLMLLPFSVKKEDSEDCHLISATTKRTVPSAISTATSSSNSVDSADSTKPLLNSDKSSPFPIIQPKRDSAAKDMSQKEINILLASGELDMNKKVFSDYRIPSMEAKVAAAKRQAYLKQGLAALAVSFGSAVVGFSSAYTSPALESMKELDSGLEVSEQEASWIGSLLPLSALFGGIIGGVLIDSLGRKHTLLLTAVPFWISFILIAAATNVGMVMAGRSIGGFAIGIASLAIPVYIGETMQPEVRGTLGLLPTALGNSGILLCFLVGKYLNWSKLAMFGACTPIPFFILMFLVPETPRWFIGENKEDKAKKALEWLRGKQYNTNIELYELKNTSGGPNKDGSSSIKDLCQKENLKPFLISIGLMFFQQMSGINAVIFYTVSIFEDAGSTIDSNLSAIIVGFVNLGSTLIATALVDRLGRKILMHISNLIMMTTLFILGTFFYFKHSNIDVSHYGWIPLASFVIYVIGFSIGSGPIPWLMMGEILPAKIRGTSASVVTSFNWLCTFIVTKTFIDLEALLGSHGTFWMFGLICALGFIFVILFVPETRGKTLEEIELFFHKRRSSEKTLP